MKNFLSSGWRRLLQRQAIGAQPPPVHDRNRRPHVVTLPPGEYRWCGCGRSLRAPLCDDADAACAGRCVPFTVTPRSGTQWLCGCGRSRQLPYCDGSSHNRID
jgi:CDGSH iron-sulfur domain-containing protein 3